MPWRAAKDFSPVAAELTFVRRFVRDTLGSWSLDGQEAVLVADDLAANAVLHARCPFNVCLSSAPGQGVRVEVADGSPGLPVVNQPDDQATSGRGLAIVAAIATRWGVEAGSPRGKVVWALIR